MDVLELLRNWPEWSKAGAETVLASPAWRLQTRVGDEVVELLQAPLPQDALALDITLDDEPHVLALADSPLYPDLHLLWAKRADLPPNLLLALVEKECGSAFMLLENVTRRQVSVKGFSAAPAFTARGFEAQKGTGSFSFSLDLTPELVSLLGRLENLDASHPSIQNLTRPCRVLYAALPLTADERSALAVGDFLLLPDAFGSEARWIDAAASEEGVSVVSADETPIPFSAFAAESLPPVPPPAALQLRQGTELLAVCSLAQVGLARALKVDSLAPIP